MAGAFRAWLAKDHLPVDAAWVAKDESWPSFFTTIAFSFSLAGIASTSWGQAHIAANPVAVWVAVLFHALLYALNIVAWNRHFACAAWWPVRLVSYAATAGAAVSFSAASSLELSPAWMAYVLFAVYISRVASEGWAIALAIALPAPLIHALGAPLVSGRSMAVAVLMAALAVLLHLFSTRISVLGQRRREQARAHEQLAEAAGERAAALRVAMSLHDGLSGALFAARQRVARAADDDAAVAAARHFLLRVQGVLGVITAHGDDPESSARDLALKLGVRLELVVRGDLTKLPVLDRDDLRELLGELVANAAVHGSPDVLLAVRLMVKRGKLTIKARFPGWDGERVRTGRGLRNIEWRAKSHGGSLRLEVGARDAELVVEWPLDRWYSSLRGYEVLLFSLTMAIGLGLGVMTERYAPLIVTLVAILFCFVLMPSIGRESRREFEKAVRHRHEAEAAPVLVLAREALEADVSELAASTFAPERAHLSAVLERLAESLHELLWALEWKGTREDLEAELEALVRERALLAVAVPAHACDDARERWLARRALRRQATDPTRGVAGPTSDSHSHTAGSSLREPHSFPSR
jgi:signal transduction histidine kinase